MLFSGQPILELSVLDFNKHCDRNEVEFSHLPAIDRSKAMAILKPGEEILMHFSFLLDRFRRRRNFGTAICGITPHQKPQRRICKSSRRNDILHFLSFLS